MEASPVPNTKANNSQVGHRRRVSNVRVLKKESERYIVQDKLDEKKNAILKIKAILITRSGRTLVAKTGQK